MKCQVCRRRKALPLPGLPPRLARLAKHAVRTCRECLDELRAAANRQPLLDPPDHAKPQNHGDRKPN